MSNGAAGRPVPHRALDATEESPTSDLAVMRRLYALHARLAGESDLSAALDEILGAALAFAGTDRGTIQLVSRDGADLEIVALRGFADDSPFIARFRHEGFAAGSEAARRERKRIVLEDLASYPPLGGTDVLQMVLSEDIRATQSIPLISHRGGTVGVLNTHYRRPHRPDDQEVGRLDLLAWTAADFIERHRAEAAVREREQRFRALVTATSYVVYRMNPDWTEMRQLDGRGFVTDTTAPRRSWLDDYVHPDDQPRVLEAVREAIRTKSVFQLEHRVRKADGGLGWTLSRAVPLLDENGEIMEWFGAASDVTARREAEDGLRALTATLERRVEERTNELRKSEQRFRRVFEGAPNPMVLTSLEDELLDVNVAFERVTGYGRDEVVGRSARRLGFWSSGEERERLEDALRLPEGAEDIEAQLRTKDGRVLDILLSATRIDSNGDRSLVKMFVDVTERKQTVRELKQALLDVLQDTSWLAQRVVERFIDLRGQPPRGKGKVSDLTLREREVLSLIANAHSNEEIARTLDISPSTVRNYVSAIYVKAGVNSRVEAAVWALERGLEGPAREEGGGDEPGG